MCMSSGRSVLGRLAASRFPGLTSSLFHTHIILRNCLNVTVNICFNSFKIVYIAQNGD